MAEAFPSERRQRAPSAPWERGFDLREVLGVEAHLRRAGVVERVLGLRRLGDHERVLLASEEARGVTAQAWNVDGGAVQA